MDDVSPVEPGAGRTTAPSTAPQGATQHARDFIGRTPVEALPGIHVLGTVQGLVADAARVAEAFDAIAPDVVALAISPADVDGLLAYLAEPEDAPFDEDSLLESEAVYSAVLSRYGPVDLPPPDLLEAVGRARAAGVPIVGVDLDEDEYADVWSSNVGIISLFKVSRATKRLYKRPPEAPDAHGFAVAWDAAMREVPALDRVEQARETRIAKGLRGLAPKRVLAVIDLARVAGVLAHLR